MLALLAIPVAPGQLPGFFSPPPPAQGSHASPPPPPGPPAPPLPTTPERFHSSDASLKVHVNGNPMQMPTSNGAYWYDEVNTRTRFDQYSSGNPTVYFLKLYADNMEYSYYTQAGTTYCKPCHLTDTMYPLKVPSTSMYRGEGDSTNTEKWTNSLNLGAMTVTGTYDVVPAQGSTASYVSKAIFDATMVSTTFTFGNVETGASSVSSTSWVPPEVCSSIEPVTLDSGSQCVCYPPHCTTASPSPPPPSPSPPPAPRPPPPGPSPKYSVSGVVMGGEAVSLDLSAPGGISLGGGGSPVKGAQVVPAVSSFVSGTVSLTPQCPGVLTDKEGQFTLSNITTGVYGACLQRPRAAMRSRHPHASAPTLYVSRFASPFLPLPKCRWLCLPSGGRELLASPFGLHCHGLRHDRCACHHDGILRRTLQPQAQFHQESVRASRCTQHATPATKAAAAADAAHPRGHAILHADPFEVHPPR